MLHTHLLNLLVELGENLTVVGSSGLLVIAELGDILICDLVVVVQRPAANSVVPSSAMAIRSRNVDWLALGYPGGSCPAGLTSHLPPWRAERA